MHNLPVGFVDVVCVVGVVGVGDVPVVVVAVVGAVSVLALLNISVIQQERAPTNDKFGCNPVMHA